jgi:hypothetical protein
LVRANIILAQNKNSVNGTIGEKPMKCPICDKEKRDHTVETVYDYLSGAMFSTGVVTDTKFKCSNGHTWEIEE